VSLFFVHRFKNHPKRIQKLIFNPVLQFLIAEIWQTVYNPPKSESVLNFHIHACYLILGMPSRRNEMRSLAKIISILLILFGIHLILAHFFGYGYIDKIDSRLISSGFRLGSNLWLLAFLFIIIGLTVFIKYETRRNSRNKRHGENNRSTRNNKVNYAQARNNRNKFSLKTIVHFIKKHKTLEVTTLIIIAIIVILLKFRVSVGNALAYELLGAVILFFILASVFVGSIHVIIMKILKRIWKL